jgi:hypothetical protein
MNRHSLLTSKTFYTQALLAWLCLIPAVWVFRYLALFAENEINFLFRMVLYIFVMGIGELFHQQPVYFVPNYTLYRICYAAGNRTLSSTQFYGGVLAYYLLVVTGGVMLFLLGEWLNYNVFYFYLIFVFIVLSLYYADNYLIPSYTRYKRLLNRRATA